MLIVPAVARALVFRRITFMIDGSIETELMKVRGLQAWRWAERNAWIAKPGVAKSMNVFAPERFSWEIWELTSASVIS